MLNVIVLAVLLITASWPALSDEALTAEASTDDASLSTLLSSELALSATLKRASIAACPREYAEQLAVSLVEGKVRGHLSELSLDLTCFARRFTPPKDPAQSEADLSVLYSLPKIDLTIDKLILYLPEGRFSGPAELAQHQQTFSLKWQSAAGASELVIAPSECGWRWQGTVPGKLLTPNLLQPLVIKGAWQPEQPLTASLSGALPTPFAGQWQLALAARHSAEGWQLLPSSQLTVPSLKWKNLNLQGLVLRPQGELALNKPWQVNLHWQQGRWEHLSLPAANLNLRGASVTAKQGQLRADLAPKVQLKGSWHYDQGLAVNVAAPNVAARDTWTWLDSWLALPVGLQPEAGQLQVAASAANLFDARQPIYVSANLNQGQVKYRDMLAEEVSAKLKLSWSATQGWRSLGPQKLSATQLNVGVPISDIHSAWRWQADGIWLSGLTAQVFEGHIALSPMAINSHPQGEAHFSDIELEKLLSYASVDGLTGSGVLKGRLPFSYEQGLSVNNGRADSQNGWISYQASEQLAASGEANISLGLTLGLLSDLRYQNLTADISMAKTGEAVINSHLQGQAPVKGKLHAVNLNYHHQENLLQLLASLRFAENLTDRLPANLQGESE